MIAKMEGDNADGRFSTALRDAIAGTGHSLSHVQRLLADRGVRVGLATLSQWRSGTRTPSSLRSMAVVGCLEDVLNMPPNSLWDLLTIPLTSGRQIGRSQVTQLAQHSPALKSALAELDLLGPPEFDDVATHVTLEIGANRCVSSITTAQVMRANRAGADRLPAFLVLDGPTATFPELHAVSGCRSGRRAERLSDGVAVVELITTTPVTRNATVLIEIRTKIEPYPVTETDSYAHVISGRLAQAIVIARFAEGCLAHAGQAFTNDQDGNELSQAARSIPAGLHNIVHDFGPGQVGVRWWWT